ncbi:Glyoxalase/bleomycin resistance protein/dioxygenase [Rhizorhabdus wittichii RW1]|uniref:Glyoxalase/bleomycin resistance protein/dioxygenase n=1 Tax=Rhizorhabdus wittichii (strain DSM 6014 / CCUG 31198 / JCM 15750 / NBRC 105917 / EY 4224 / RW1) TaxID=392499 RepID=A0A9J9LEC5_RHIWR|nr:Glyoxalase/bleomycin resistance protein/dioxygenase [Rhizorhabdus wittichii RW1]
MPIGGIESVVYGVDDLDVSARFYDDFGLKAVRRSDAEVVYRLDEGSRVVLRHAEDPSLPPRHYDGCGVRETFYGVDSREELAHYAERIGADRELRWSGDGDTIHFLADGGIPLGLRLWRRQPVVYAPDPVNAPDNVKRLNQHRRWRVRAVPKTINHVVWRVADIHACFAFFRDRLDFRMTDYQKDAGVFGRPAAAAQHHTVYFQKFDALPPFTQGFDHIAFGVEDIDEIYAGWNYMERRGHRNPLGGVGRHRIASALFCYFDAPCGGMAEYGADTDYLDDNWVPRVWEARFGGFMWTSRVLPFLPEELSWEVSLDQSALPQGAIPVKVRYPAEPAVDSHG